MTSDRGYSDFVHTCIRTQSTKELNQKLAKSMARRHSLWGIYMRKIYPCKKMAVKEGGGCFLEGGVFSGTYGTIPPSPFSLILHWYHQLCLKSLCLQIVIVELVNKEQKCKHLCIVFTHECRGRFLTLHVHIFYTQH